MTASATTTERSPAGADAPLHVAMLGASRGIGRGALIDILATRPNATAVLLLRNPSVFDDVAPVADAINAGRVRIVTGDATNPDDVRQLFDKRVDVVITSVGGVPHFTLRGFALDQPRLCTAATLALLSVLRGLRHIPRVVAVSSMGIGDKHDKMPLAMRLLYPWMLSGPHADKEGLEYLLQRAGRFDAPTTHMPPEHILSSVDADVPQCFIPETIIVRPALLTDGAALGLEKVKASEDACVYSVSRADAALFVARECLPPNDRWVNKGPVLGY